MYPYKEEKLYVLDVLYIWMCWMCCIFGCIVYLAELVIIGLGIRLRQGFAGRDCE